MVDHIGRKVCTLLLLLLVSAFGVSVLGCRTGIDSQEGTRLTYSFDFDKALAEGGITEQQHANQGELIEEFIGIWMRRVDPDGIKGVVIREEGENRVVIELPSGAAPPTRDAKIGLESAVGLKDVALYLERGEGKATEAYEEIYKAFPTSGGLIEIKTNSGEHAERMRYAKRVGNRLEGLVRGAAGTDRIAHSAEGVVSLLGSDPWRQIFENTGRVSFYMEARDADLRDPKDPKNSTDLIRERAKMQAWVAANPGSLLHEYNLAVSNRKGPVSRLRWFAEISTDPDQIFENLAQPLVIEKDEEWRFSGPDFANFFQSQDNMDLPALGFASIPDKAQAFGDFTEAHEGKRMAIVINDKIVTFPTINSRLQGSGIIKGGSGGFTWDEVDQLLAILNSGALVVRPHFESQETLGEPR